ncbi:MAG: Taurine catabolism dioxygenase [uncultured Thiotrichaceae bacterium]|uniref:Taurine catabolism dioxygenase n=1 Tax=uncultured Thiotrichaceae bacterium TaxID=298394 RepID=A0A6S6UKG5_9GAMM|nr:MAG: Taurine catabolism dioxygenase [uncultured Thiotrichaceae bacterium]
MTISNPHPAISSYPEWRQSKLSTYPLLPEQLIIDIPDINGLTHNIISQMSKNITKHNFSFYRFENPDQNNKQAVHNLATNRGLIHVDNNLCSDADNLTSIEVRENRGQHEYVPYTSRPINWHTDGYYNADDKQIHGVILHCARPAIEGGMNYVLDHDIAYILLKDENPAYIDALCHPNAMTIPANILNGEIIRPEQTGPVFSYTRDRRIHMRYSARLRNIIWRDDDATQEALAFLRTLWESDSPYILSYKLQAGEGFISNNVLHARTTFKDHNNKEMKRLLYRGRFFDAVNIK